ncbi:MAG: RelA/SpoT family protein [Rhizobiales bacterium]|nr:RelA/SpoT family protein [Hyphomicrobiales bacterium]
MRQFELVERVQSYHPGADIATINKAYVFAMRAHKDQKRASGEAYFTHPQAVAAILTDLRLDDATIAAALLHDVVEDTPTTVADIADEFGEEIAGIVEGLTKLKQLDLATKRAEQAENFRKLLIAISSDVRVLLIKLADRLHNMRTLESMRDDKRRRISEETIEIYAPLAGRMGMQGLREELEELAFRWMEPEAFRIVSAKLAEMRERNAGLIEEIKGSLEENLRSDGLVPVVHGREKKPFSIWRKMEHRQLSLEQLCDIYAFRVIVANVQDCYRILGRIHTTWPAVPDRFKDFISTPKHNGYRSLHTTVLGPRHQPVELQIRTGRMHQIAEYGIAAHSFYKDASYAGEEVDSTILSTGVRVSGPVSPHDSEPYSWLRRHVETLLSGDSPEEFLEHTKLELFQDQVFAFTPKGRLIALPRGATLLDFAYAVHTDVGDHCVGARVNGRSTPLMEKVQNGVQVEIITSEAQTPTAAWEKLVITGKARSAIRRASREALRRQYGDLGRQIVAAAFARVGHSFSDGRLAQALWRLSLKTVDDAYVAVARGELTSGAVLKAVFPDLQEARPASPERTARNRHEQGDPSLEGWFNLRHIPGFKFRIGDDEAERRLLQMLPRVAPSQSGASEQLGLVFGELGAVPGDRIVGILMPEQAMIAIYPIASPALEAFQALPRERWIDVTWDVDSDAPRRFLGQIETTALNEPGALARIATVIGERDGNIDNLRMLHRAADFTRMHIDVEVWNAKHLNELLRDLRMLDVVYKVERCFTPSVRARDDSVPQGHVNGALAPSPGANTI